MTSYFRQNSSFLFVILICVFCSILNTTFNFSQLNIQLFTQLNIQLLSFIDLERGGFGEILPEVMIFPEGPKI
jgi:hypothetical protein